VKLSCRYASQTRTPSSHSFYMSSIKGSKNTSISMSSCFGPETRIVNKRYFLLWHNHEGMLYMLRITDQVLCGFVISPKGFIPSVLKANLTFLGSLENSGWLTSKVFHYWASAGWRRFPSFLHPSGVACQIMSLASLALENILFKRSSTGMYHITRARIFLSLTSSSHSSIFFLLLPNR
jgi:hypothetical protein